MQNFRRTFLAAWSAALVGAPDRAGAQMVEHSAAPPASQTTDANVEAQGLSREVRLETVLEIAERANPEIREAQERVRSAAARASSANRLPDLEAKYEQWGVPLARPYALNEAGTLMLGLRQTIPAPGVLGARSRAAGGEARMQAEAERVRQQDVRQRLKRAFYDYYRTWREYRIHLEHVQLESHIIELARQNYQVGRATQQDVLRTVVDLSRLHNDVADLVQQLDSSKALLNTLMARPVDAALGPPGEISPTLLQFAETPRQDTAPEHRPEIASAKIGVERSEAALDAAKTEARVPSIMVGADYWYQPTSSVHHAYGAMVSINLPWLNGRHRDRVREEEHALAGDIRALESARNAALFDLRDAQARLKAAQQSLRIIDGDLLPQARQSFEAAQSAFAAGKGDALGLLDSARSYLQVRVEHARALARVGSSTADLERALGVDAPGAAPPPQERQQ
jgi:cobalt-zinc-cadmium efflux system outer membrane protein